MKIEDKRYQFKCIQLKKISKPTAYRCYNIEARDSDGETDRFFLYYNNYYYCYDYHYYYYLFSLTKMLSEKMSFQHVVEDGSGFRRPDAGS